MYKAMQGHSLDICKGEANTEGIVHTTRARERKWHIWKIDVEAQASRHSPGYTPDNVATAHSESRQALSRLHFMPYIS